MPSEERSSPRHFTVAEANALIPWLGETLPRLRFEGRGARDAAVEMERIKAVGLTDDGVLIMAHDYKLAKRRFDGHRRAFEELLAEVRARGCLLKDLDSGLVDFPALVDGEAVLLCWRLGEPAVSHFHNYRDGYRGRQPLPPSAR